MLEKNVPDWLMATSILLISVGISAFLIAGAYRMFTGNW
jgi:hypothetical protein